MGGLRFNPEKTRDYISVRHPFDLASIGLLRAVLMYVRYGRYSNAELLQV